MDSFTVAKKCLGRFCGFDQFPVLAKRLHKQIDFRPRIIELQAIDTGITAEKEYAPFL
jgi:hypothetical protein